MQYGPHSRGTTASIKDKALVYDWEEISSNPLEFKEFLEKYKEEDEKVIWICSFCEQKNLLDSFEVPPSICRLNSPKTTRE